VKASTLHKSDFVQQNAANTKTNKKYQDRKAAAQSALSVIPKKISVEVS
jgi:hypothetical protein